jgi:hypothetical protein
MASKIDDCGSAASKKRTRTRNDPRVETTKKKARAGVDESVDDELNPRAALAVGPSMPLPNASTSRSSTTNQREIESHINTIGPPPRSRALTNKMLPASSSASVKLPWAALPAYQYLSYGVKQETA